MEQEVTDCHRILRTSEKKMTRSGREGESRVSLDDTAAADSRRESRFGSCYVWNGMEDREREHRVPADCVG